MADNIPEGAKVMVVSGSGGGAGDFWLTMLRQRCPALLDTWEVRAPPTPGGESVAECWAGAVRADGAP